MEIFSKIRDKPTEKRNRQLSDFVRGVDLDYNVSSGVQVDELTAMQTSAVRA